MLDGILYAKDHEDASIGIRCSCRAAICGSCGVRINGKTALACNTRISDAAARAGEGRPIVVEPMGNMPVLKDLIVDMDAVHWKKVQRVVPWLLPDGDPPDREYVVPPESMIDVTQSMACIHCGVCVGACLSLEVDPEFVGPAALAKAYRFVGDPRDGQTEERLRDLAEDPHGLYDCTHCFACVEVCPKDVAPMNQIMRLRRRATGDHEIKDANNGYGHEKALRGHHRALGHAARGPAAAALVRRRVAGQGPAHAQRRQAAAGEPAHRGARACGRARSRPARPCSTPSCPTRTRLSGSTRRSRRPTSASS